MASIYPESVQSKFLSAEKDLDDLLKIGGEGATVCREAPIFDKYSDSDDDCGPFSCTGRVPLSPGPDYNYNAARPVRVLEGHRALRTTRIRLPPCGVHVRTTFSGRQATPPYYGGRRRRYRTSRL
jgi:hypothetical protein